MRVVLVHRYFWPDTPPYAHILRDIALELGRAGHQVTIVTCQPSYHGSMVRNAPKREQLAPGVVVRRGRVLPDRQSAALKGVNLVVLCVRVMLTAVRPGGVDVVMAASTPPIAVARTASWLARLKGAAFVSHKQDIYPEIVLAPAIMRPGLLASFLRRADSRTDRRAARVVVLSQDMAETMASRGVAAERTAVINNFDPWEIGTDPEDRAGARRDGGRSTHDAPLSVVFAGNLGRFQRLETIVEAAVALRDDPDIEFHFFGDGVRRGELERTVAADGLHQVQIHGYQPPERVAAFLRNHADLGVVALAPGAIRAAYPSKTMSYLRQGCAVLVLVEADSELAGTLVAAGAGFQGDQSDGGALAETLRKLAERREDVAAAGDRARELYDALFDPARQLALWRGLFDDVRDERAS